MNAVGDRKTQVAVKGVLVNAASAIWGPKVVIHEQILEFTGTTWREVDSKTYLADYGSDVVAEAMAPHKAHWLRGFFERFSRVFAANANYILGEEGIQAIEETALDRRLAHAVAMGATMDPASGIIHGFDRE